MDKFQEAKLENISRTLQKKLFVFYRKQLF